MLRRREALRLGLEFAKQTLREDLGVFQREIVLLSVSISLVWGIIVRPFSGAAQIHISPERTVSRFHYTNACAMCCCTEYEIVHDGPSFIFCHPITPGDQEHHLDSRQIDAESLSASFRAGTRAQILRHNLSGRQPVIIAAVYCSRILVDVLLLKPVQLDTAPSVQRRTAARFCGRKA